MSTNRIDEMTEREAKSLLSDICHIFHIGGISRTPSTILTNVENSYRRCDCLSRIENHLTTFEPGDETEAGIEVSLLNWGESPEQYIETFKKVWNTRHLPPQVAAVIEAAPLMMTMVLVYLLKEDAVGFLEFFTTEDGVVMSDIAAKQGGGRECGEVVREAFDAIRALDSEGRKTE